MSRKYRDHSKQFIEQAVNMVLKEKVLKSEVCRSLDIAQSLLDKWLADYAKKGDFSKETKGAKSVDKERIRQLEAENKILREEREILKKAAAFFAKDSK